MKKNWRPVNWKKDKRTKLGMLLGINALQFDRTLMVNTYEAGADAMLEELFKMAKESPTGTFVIDSNMVTVYRGKEGE